MFPMLPVVCARHPRPHRRKGEVRVSISCAADADLHFNRVSQRSRLGKQVLLARLRALIWGPRRRRKFDLAATCGTNIWAGSCWLHPARSHHFNLSPSPYPLPPLLLLFLYILAALSTSCAFLSFFSSPSPSSCMFLLPSFPSPPYPPPAPHCLICLPRGSGADEEVKGWGGHTDQHKKKRKKTDSAA